MPIDARRRTLTQGLSPAYPTGGFAFSHGLEQAIAEAWVQDAATLHDWLSACLTEGSGRADAIWLRLAAQTDDVLALNAEARAFAASAERIAESERQGAAFLRTTNAVWGLDLPEHLLMPLAVGCAAGAAGLDLDACVHLYLQSFASNLVSAAQRLMALGQTDAQAVLHALAPVLIRVAEDTNDATQDDIFSNAFLSDIAAMRHETLEPRLFQS